MKYHIRKRLDLLELRSRPARGAWIEISCTLIVALLS